MSFFHFFFHCSSFSGEKKQKAKECGGDNFFAFPSPQKKCTQRLDGNVNCYAGFQIGAIFLLVFLSPLPLLSIVLMWKWRTGVPLSLWKELVRKELSQDFTERCRIWEGCGFFFLSPRKASNFCRRASLSAPTFGGCVHYGRRFELEGLDHHCSLHGSCVAFYSIF